MSEDESIITVPIIYLSNTDQFSVSFCQNRQTRVRVVIISNKISFQYFFFLSEINE